MNNEPQGIDERIDSCLRKTFVEHPESVGENYVTHGMKAFWFGARLIAYGCCEIVHAIVPGVDIFELCGTHSHLELKKICDELKERKEE